MDEKVKEKIALFRFSLIAPLLNNTFAEATAKAYLASTVQKPMKSPFMALRNMPLKLLKAGSLNTRSMVLTVCIPTNVVTKEYRVP